MRTIIIYCTFPLPEHASGPKFGKQLFRVAPGVHGGALEFTTKLFWGKYSRESPAIVVVENESEVEALRQMCKDYGISCVEDVSPT